MCCLVYGSCLVVQSRGVLRLRVGCSYSLGKFTSECIVLSRKHFKDSFRRPKTDFVSK